MNEKNIFSILGQIVKEKREKGDEIIFKKKILIFF